jgi:putative ABC transport system ATP-binding protein
MPFIELIDAEKTYGKGTTIVRAVHDVNLSIERGEFILVVGPSGAGKTTLLNLLGGMEKPTAGKVIFDGTDLGQLDERGLTRYRRHEVGFVFQFYNLIASLTARENVELAGELCDDPLPAEEILGQVGLGQRLDNFPAQLSGGEQQRVAIARALAKKPRLILADEPTGALDFKTGRAVLELLQRVCRESGETLVLITHNLAFSPIADRVIHVANGTIERIESNASPASASTLTW